MVSTITELYLVTFMSFFFIFFNMLNSCRLVYFSVAVALAVEMPIGKTLPVVDTRSLND
jgi:hypothetical protein